MKTNSFKEISANEALYTIGGADKNVKDLLYEIGYLLGKLVGKMSKKKNVQPTADFAF